MKKNILIFTILALLMPLSFSSCNDEWEDDLIGGYYCEYTDTYIMLRADRRGYIADYYDKDYFTWWAGKYTITFSFDRGGIENYEYRFTHDGLYIGDDFYYYEDYPVYLKKKAAKMASEKKTTEKKEAEVGK